MNSWLRLKLWLGLASLLLGYSFFQQPGTQTCCCPSPAQVSQSDCACGPQLCECAPSSDDRMLPGAPMLATVLCSETRSPVSAPATADMPAVNCRAPFLGPPDRPKIQPRGPPARLA